MSSTVHDGAMSLRINPAFTPFDYQTEAFDAAWAIFDRGKRSTLAALSTGLGKTVLAAMMAAEQIRRGGRVLFLAHRDELLQGAMEDFDFVGVPTALEKAECRAQKTIENRKRDFWNPADIRCVIGSVQTLKGKRLATWDEDYFDLIICDEAHHGVKWRGGKKHGSTTVMPAYRAIFSHFSGAKLFGQTGSPNRGDNAELGFLYEELCYEYMLREAILNGDLCRIVPRMANVAIDLTKVRTEGAGLNQGDLEDAVRPYMQKMCNAIREELGGRRILVFTPGRDSVDDKVRPCELFAAGLNRMGFRAAAVWGDHPKRQQIADLFRSGHYDCVCCADLYNEGVNFPFVDGIALASPTNSPVVLGQRIGRGTRKFTRADGSVKEDCRILSFDWQFEENKYHVLEPYELIRPAGADRALSAVVRKVQASRPDAGLIEVLDEAERIAEADKIERARREARDAELKRQRDLPITLDLEVGDSGLTFRTLDPFACFDRKKHKGPSKCGPEWVEALALLGYPREQAKALNDGEAEAMRDALYARHEAGLASPTQVRQLIGMGVKRGQAERYTRYQASTYIIQRSRQIGHFSGRRRA